MRGAEQDHSGADRSLSSWVRRRIGTDVPSGGQGQGGRQHGGQPHRAGARIQSQVRECGHQFCLVGYFNKNNSFSVVLLPIMV